MQDNQRVVFHTTLTGRDWDEELSGWRCPALKIPAAEVECVFVSGSRVDKSWYEVSSDLNLIRWIRSDPPDQATVLIRLTQELSTKELTLRWKKLAVILPLLVAVMSGIFSYFSPFRRSQPGAEQSATNATATCSERVKITKPVDLQRVGVTEMVEGSYQNISPSQKIWVVIYTPGIGGYYPQNPAKEETDSTWLAEATIGLVDRDSGKEFFIYAVSADKAAQEALSSYIKQARTENDSPGIPELPKGAQICDHIKVIRK